MTVQRALRDGALVFGLIVVASTSVSAKNSRMVNIAYPATLNGTHVPAGDYEVSWETHSPEAAVTLADSSRVVVSTSWHWEARSTKSQNNSVLYDTNADGTRLILEIRFAGIKGALVFGPTA